MKRRLFLAVALVMLVSTPLASPKREMVCTIVNDCYALCCDTRTHYCLYLEWGDCY